MDHAAPAVWDELWRLLSLRDANTRVVLAGTGLLGLASGVIGTFAVLRRRALVGDAVAHAALPGICLAYFTVGTRSFTAFLVGALISGVFAAASIAFVRAFTRVKEDAAIGIVIGSFFGLGLVLSKIIQDQPTGNAAGLGRFLLGSAAAMVRADAWRIAGVAGAIVVCVALLYKEFKVLCFDTPFAASTGLPTAGLDLLLMALICICTVVGLPAVGVVLMVALLIIPGVTARFWTDRLGSMLLIAGAVGLGSGVVGTALSDVMPTLESMPTRGWPTGAMIVLTAGACFVVSLLAAPRRGVLAGFFRRWGVRRRVADQHLLRAVYESLEPDGNLRRAWRIESLTTGRRPGRIAGGSLRRAQRRRWLERTPDGYALTQAGADQAARQVRTHRLWELFLIDQASIAPDHVDRDADQLEHVLPADVLARIEGELERQGRLPKPVPPSPHPIAGAERSPAR
ncbi:MAG: metal ABC transporter permease [Phycisphaerales bacterium]